jgi:cyanophycinase
MNARRLCLLLGGSDAFDTAAGVFIPAAGGSEARIALLLQGGHDWQRYVPQYVEPWIKAGIAGCYPIAPQEDGSLHFEGVRRRLLDATGIFVGGGHSPTYQRLYATDPISSIIRERFLHGVPYAGVSAGALIAPQVCAIPPEDTGEPSVRILAGLGLMQDCVIGVHFSEWNALPHVLEAMAITRTATAWGIDEDACAVFEDGRFGRALGGTVHEISMTDFATMAHEITEHSSSS